MIYNKCRQRVPTDLPWKKLRETRQGKSACGGGLTGIPGSAASAVDIGGRVDYSTIFEYFEMHMWTGCTPTSTH